MNLKMELISYQQTGYFSKIITDYLSQNDQLKNFYQHPVNLDGIKNSISEREKFKTDRKLLAQELQKQYDGVETSDKVKANISAIFSENTFTVCTAHQPNIFTGHLYFVYKIIHTIKLADTLKIELPNNNFVPVFYMGSEDADLDELGQVFINGQKYEWTTKQTGAVGRMIVDDDLLDILEKIRSQISVEPFGKEIIALVEECYQKGRTIQQACFYLVNKLFSSYGLIVLLPDNAELKKTMTNIFENDIFNNTSSEIVNKTAAKLSANYKVQAHPREINLFYLKDNIRNRIVRTKEYYKIADTEIKLSEDELRNELKNYPERFSPNVILRALYQETILPNLAFIGGGGELAYWLELKDLFQHYQIPYPVLILRNSFAIIEQKISGLLKKLFFSAQDIFKSESELMNEIVKKNSKHTTSLEKEKQQLNIIYDDIKNNVTKIDQTLIAYSEALLVKALHKIENLEKKMLKAEKLKFDAEQRQIKKIRSNLFPNNELQERVENFIPYYAKWGKEFFEVIYNNSVNLEQQFCMIEEQE